MNHKTSIEACLQDIFGDTPKPTSNYSSMEIDLTELSDPEVNEFKSKNISIENSLQEPADPTKIKNIPDRYRSKAYSVGDSIICQSRKELKEKVASACLAQDKTVIRKGTSKKSCIIWKCYYSFFHKYDSVSKLKTESLCPFYMKGELTHTTEDTEEFVLTKLQPYHNHTLMSDGSVKTGKSNRSMPSFYKRDILDLHRIGLQENEIHELLNAKYVGSSLTLEALILFLDKKRSKDESISSEFFKDFFHKNVVEDDLVISKDPVDQRIFITSIQNIGMWNGLRDVLLIDTTRRIKGYFKLMIMMITIDAFGVFKLIALGICRFRGDVDYDWIYNEFKNKGFISPQLIIVDTNNDYSIEKHFKYSSTFFTYRCLRRKINKYMANRKFNQDAFKTRFSPVFYAETEQIFENEWISLINEYPTSLGGNIEFMALHDQKDKWAMYSVKKVLTVGMFSSKGMKCLEKSCENVVSTMNISPNTKIFSKLNEQFGMTDKFNYDILYEIQDIGTVFDILREISDLQSLYTDYCIYHVIISLVDLQLCSCLSKTDNHVEIEDRSLTTPKIFEINNDCISCPCKKMTIYGIPCAHLLCAYFTINNQPLNEYIVRNISRRGILPQNCDLSHEEITQKIKKVPIRMKKAKKKRFITNYYKQ